MIEPIMITDRNWSIDYTKADLSRRNNIIVVSNIIEDLSAENTELFIKILNSRYSYSVGDVAPYHYYVDTNGTIYQSKDDVLKLNPTSELKSFENDLVVMVMNSDISKMPTNQEAALTELLSVLSYKYKIASNRISFYPDNYAFYDDNISVINNIINNVILYKNQKDNLNYICENADSDTPYVSDYLGLLKTDSDCYTMKDLSVRLNVREDILRQINPHIEGDSRPGQLIFYPKTITIKARELSDYIKKQTSKYYDLCKIILKE